MKDLDPIRFSLVEGELYRELYEGIRATVVLFRKFLAIFSET